MSLLEQLKNSRSKLKPSETVVTYQNGEKFVETKSLIRKIDEKSPGYVVDTKPDSIPAQIIENLFLGSQDCCDNGVLDLYDITNVLSVGVEAPIKYPNITYKFVEILDLPDTNLNQYLENCISFIQTILDKGEKVLVHCNAGVSRSASVVIAYLILKRNFSFEKAYETVKMSRSCIRPNDGFMSQLKLLS